MDNVGVNSIICKYCGVNIVPEDYFCPSCGKELKAKLLSEGIWKQIGIYSLSFFLPPFGLWPGIKYLRQPDDKSKMIGFISILLTVVSIDLSFWITAAFLGGYSQMLNSLSNGTYKSF